MHIRRPKSNDHWFDDYETVNTSKPLFVCPASFSIPFLSMFGFLNFFTIALVAKTAKPVAKTAASRIIPCIKVKDFLDDFPVFELAEPKKED